MATESLSALKAEAITQASVAPIDYAVIMPVIVCFLFGAALLMMRKKVASMSGEGVSPGVTADSESSDLPTQNDPGPSTPGTFDR
mgnify:CR=1 FL=1